MNAKPYLSLVLSLCVFPPVLSQKPAADDDVVKITTNLVQIDAIVTKDGKSVTDLKADDFEIFEDGRKQTITSFAYVSNVPATAPVAVAADRDKSVPPPPLKRDDPRRTLAIVVDDLGLSAESMSDVRRQLRKFVDEQIQPYDLVAIIRTGTQIGALQQFTNDKRLLDRAVDQLRWNHCSRAGVQVLPPSQAIIEVGTPDQVCGGYSFFWTMRALRYIIDGMAELPGRKSMLVLSDSLPTESQDSAFFSDSNSPFSETMNRVWALQRVAEKAIRASVVIYSVDTQGLQTTGITAADRFGGNARQLGQQMNAVMAARSRALFDRRVGGEMMARQTGGFQIKNSNDFKLDRILEEQNGYYLIGYRPTEETFNRQFHRITAKVKRSGTTLRTRYGFFGYSEEDTVKKPQSKTNLALMSPFGAQDINLEFTAFFANDKAAGSVIRSFLYLDAKDLTFVKTNDKHEANVELYGVIYGVTGAVVDQIQHTAKLSLIDKDYERSLSEGIRIRFDMPAKRPGAFQVRVAARDVASSRIGSTGQFVAVPNLKNKRLAVSGIVLRGVADFAESETTEVAAASPAVRRFFPNTDLYFALVIYNAAIDPALRRPNLVLETKLFRDGKRVHSYPESPVDLADQPDLERIFVSRMLRLGANLEPGHYYLQVEITDKASKDKEQAPVVEWIDFDIVK
jgi:VWFA-related protein